MSVVHCEQPNELNAHREKSFSVCKFFSLKPLFCFSSNSADWIVFPPFSQHTLIDMETRFHI